MGIGHKIKALREASGLTQEELGRRCGTTKQTIFKYESGIVTNIPLKRLGNIAKALNTTVYEMIGDDWSGIDLSDAWGEPNTDVKIAYSGLRPEDSAADGIDTQESDLVQTFRSLNPLGKDEAIFYVHHLADQEVFTKEDPAAE